MPASACSGLHKLALFKAISDTEYEFVPKASVLYGQWCIDARRQIQPEESSWLTGVHGPAWTLPSLL